MVRRQRERLVHHDIAPCFQALLGILKMHITGSRHHHQSDRLVLQHLLDRPRNLHPGIRLRRFVSFALHNRRQLQPLGRSHHGGMKNLSRHPKPDHTHTNAVSHIPSFSQKDSRIPHTQTVAHSSPVLV